MSVFVSRFNMTGDKSSHAHLRTARSVAASDPRLSNKHQAVADEHWAS